MWQLNPKTGDLTRILQIDRMAVPFSQTDTDPDDLGDWESSGVLDVSKLFDVPAGETLLLFNTQAHSLRGGLIDDSNLVQGGQILFAEGEVRPLGRPNRDALTRKLIKWLILSQGKPNPFHERTKLSYTLTKKARVNLSVYDLNGRLVKTLAQGEMNAETYEVQWDGNDDKGKKMKRGLYIAQLQAGDEMITTKLMKEE